MKKTVLIVDDHPLFREGLKSLIARNPMFEVVGEAGKASDALRKAKDLGPALAIVDISLPDRSGIELTRELSATLPRMRVLIVSMHARIDTITEAFRAGAAGYVVKDSASDKVVQGLEAVSRGEYFLDSALSHSVVERLVAFPEKAAKITDKSYNTLTSREQEIMRLLAEGLSPKEIGTRLFISSKTVENHRFSIMSKLDLHSSMELVRYAAKLGLIDVDRWKD
ncbi:MAG: response regulator [Syntrophobacteraceae bacterium]